MLGDYLGIIILFVLIIIFGVYLGKMERREMQEKYCPYCSCRECCGVGWEVSPKCEEEELESFKCMKTN